MFVLKHVNPDASFTDELRALRDTCGWTVTEAAQASGVPTHLIRALEDARFEDLPDDVYAERMVAQYVRALHGKDEYMLTKFRNERVPDMVPRGAARFIRPTRPLFRELLSQTRLLAVLGATLLVATVGTYLGIQISHVRSAPTLEITAPEEGSQLTEALVTVRGKTEPEVQVSINGVPIHTTPDGTFSSQVDLMRGTTSIEIQAKRRYGGSKTETRRVIFSPKAAP